MRGRIRVYTKKKNKKYVFKQAVILVKSKYIRELEALDGQEVEFYLGPPQKNSNSIGELEKKLLQLLVRLFIKAFNDFGERLINYEETEQILSIIKKMRGE